MDELETKVTEGQETETQEKTYSQAEVDELLQKETDRRVTSALKKQELKNSQKVREAEKVAAMSAEEKYRYELDQREAAIAAKERELTLAENRNVCSKILSEKGMSLDLVNFVVADDAEAMNANIKSLEKAFKASVKAEVERRLGTPTPKKSLEDVSTMTKEQFKNIKDVSTLMKLKEENPELWNSLAKDYF